MAGGHLSGENLDAEALEILLQAPSKAKVNEVFLLAFRSMHGPTESHLKKTIQQMGGEEGGMTNVSSLRHMHSIHAIHTRDGNAWFLSSHLQKHHNVVVVTNVFFFPVSHMHYFT
jgi:hypothetical protein